MNVLTGKGKNRFVLGVKKDGARIALLFRVSSHSYAHIERKRGGN